MLKILSLFDGLSSARLALYNIGVDCEYFAAEIDKYSLAVSKYNFPNPTFNINYIGDVEKLNFKNFKNIDLLIAGFPCQSLSIAKLNRNGLKGKSKLFFKCVEALKICKPKYVILENVASMAKKDKDIISQYLNIEPIMIDSSLLTAQMRKRYYWCNFPVSQPADEKIKLQSILVSGITDREKSYCIDASYYKGKCSNPYYKSGRRQMVKENGEYRLLHPVECERLQSIHDNYTQFGDFDGKIKPISNTQRYKMLGNSFTVSVIEHILRHIL